MKEFREVKDNEKSDCKKFHTWVCEDGSIHSGVVEVNIDDKVEDYPISALAENINYMSLPSDILC